MRLNELHGYKNNKDVAEFKRIHNLYGDHPGDRVDIIQDFSMYLEERGFELLGQGGFGLVFLHPDPRIDYCIKVFKKDPAYLGFVKYCLANASNPHLPKFKGKFMSVDNHYYAVRLEILSKRLDAVDKGIIDMCGVAKYLIQYEKTNTYPGMTDSIAARLKEQPLFVPTMIDVYRNVGNFNMDLFENNFMKRKSNLVITDPYWASEF